MSARVVLISWPCDLPASASQSAGNYGFQLHPCPCKGHELIPFLWLHSIPLCICTTFSFLFLLLSSGVHVQVCYMSSQLWIVLQWTYACMYLYNRIIYIPLGIYPVMGLLGQMIFLVLDLWGITTLSSTMVELIYILTNSVKACSYFSTALSASVISWLFNSCHSDWHEMVYHCDFDLHFSNDW